MFGQNKGQIGPTQWLKLGGNLILCSTINHTGHNPKVHYGNKDMWEKVHNVSLWGFPLCSMYQFMINQYMNLYSPTKLVVNGPQFMKPPKNELTTQSTQWHETCAPTNINGDAQIMQHKSPLLRFS